MSEIIAMFVCIVFNSILSLTEMAFVSVGKSKLREMARGGNRDAQRLITLRDNPERTLSILQIGITLLGAIAAATGGISIEEALNPYLENNLGLSESSAEVLGIILVVLPLTYLSVVVGELVPKTLALRNPQLIALRSAKWLVLADKALMPVVNVLEWSTKKILRVISPRSKPLTTDGTSDPVTIDHLSAPHRQYILNLVNIENKRIRDVYVPLQDVTFILPEYDVARIHRIFIESGYTRIPVMLKNEVIGILHSKEFMALYTAKNELLVRAINWTEIIRPAFAVHPDESLIKVLRMIQEKKIQMVFVKQDNEILGIVTLEDIIEEIIGDVFDEDEDDSIKRILSTGSSMRSPRTSL